MLAPLPLELPEVGAEIARDGEAAVMGVDVVDDQGYGDPRPRALAMVPLDGSPPTTFSIDADRWTYDQLLKADERTAWQPDGSSISVLVTERATGDKAILRHDPATDGGASALLIPPPLAIAHHLIRRWAVE